MVSRPCTKIDPSPRRNLLRALLLCALAGCCALSGCVTARQYRLAGPEAGAVAPLDLRASAGPLDAKLGGVIVTRGPGSWKLVALWDEYLVSFANRGEQAVTVESARLLDARDQPRSPGEEPWALEDLTNSGWNRYGRSSLQVAGAIADVATIISVSHATCNATGYGVAGCAGLGTAKTVFTALPAIGLIDLAVVAYLDQDNKETVQKEFQRRRLVLPLVVPPGKTVAGSLFFPITPRPGKLMLAGRSGEQALEVVIEVRGAPDPHTGDGK
jgi:hypothetical protein